jgi:hypothetical protein
MGKILQGEGGAVVGDPSLRNFLRGIAGLGAGALLPRLPVWAQVQRAILVPDYAGVYQVDTVVPPGITSGNAVPVILQVAGQTSPPVTMAVR